MRLDDKLLLQSALRGLLLAGYALLSASALAHHSTAMYDYAKNRTLSGVVRDFRWTNPHCYLQLAVRDAKGQEQEWAIETGTPSISTGMGWKRNSLKAGDKVTAIIHPLRDGSNGGTLVTVTLPNGNELKGAGALLEADPSGVPGGLDKLPSLERVPAK